MTLKSTISFSALCFCLLLASCKDKVEGEPCDPELSELRVSVQPVFGGQTLHLDSTYTTAEGYAVQFTDLLFIAENVTSASGQLKDVALFDYRVTGTALFTGPGRPEDFTTFAWNLGVQSSINHSDPSAFPNESVLNISNSGGMHWGWNPGYIFMKVEAKVDTIPDGNALFDHLIVFHIGQDVNLQTINFSNINWQQTGNLSYHFPLKLDLQKFLQNGQQTINLRNEYTSHTAPGQEVLSLKVIQNFKAALTEF